MYYIFNSQTHIHTYIDTISKIKNVIKIQLNLQGLEKWKEWSTVP